MTAAAQSLRNLVQGSTLPIPGVFDALSAQLAAQAGFEAVLCSRETLAAAGLSLRGTVLAPEAAVFTAAALQTRTGLPLMLDLGPRALDPAFEVRHSAETLRDLGAIAVGDAADGSDDSLVEIERQAEQLAALAKDCESGPILIARTAAANIAEAQQRAEAYLAAGAEWILVSNLTREEELEEFASAFEAPLAVEVNDFDSRMQLHCEELAEMGYAAVLFPWTLLRVAAKAMEAALALLAQEGATHELLDLMTSPEELDELLRP